MPQEKNPWKVERTFPRIFFVLPLNAQIAKTLCFENQDNHVDKITIE